MAFEFYESNHRADRPTLSVEELDGRTTSGLSARLEELFCRYRHSFGYLQALVFFVMVVLLFVPAFMALPPEDAGITEDFSLFANFVIWALWFPLMFLSVIVAGRLWCGTLCPQGAVSEYISRRGLAKAPPRWLRRGWVAIVSFILITIFGQIVGVRDYPLATLEVLGGTTLLAVLVGYIYGGGRRVWCRYVCPMGPLLGVLSRLGPVSFENSNGACSPKGYSCPTFINTATKRSSANCIECFRCVEPGEARSLRLRLRRLGSEIEDVAQREPNLWEVAFLFLSTGLALGAFYWQISPLYIRLKHMLGDIFLEAGMLHLVGSSGPRWLMVNWPEAGEVFLWLDVLTITLFMVVSMVAVAAVLGLTTLVAAGTTGWGTLKERFSSLGYVYTPVALISLLLGLGQPLFQAISGGLGIAKELVRLAELTLFAGGGLWSLWLAYRVTRGGLLPTAVVTAGAGLLAMLWYGVLF